MFVFNTHPLNRISEPGEAIVNTVSSRKFSIEAFQQRLVLYYNPVIH